MPVDPTLQYSNASIVVPSPTADQQPRNNQVIKDQQRYAKPWGMRVYQGVNFQSPPANAITQVGFDSLSFNTYQSLGQPKYSLIWAPVTLSTFVYKYGALTVPVSGMYWLATQCVLTASSAATSWTESLISQNGTIIISGENSWIQASANVNSPVSWCGDYYYLNAGDVITCSIDIVGTAGWQILAASLPRLTYFSIRYMGPG